jgi:hypothetical protein
VNAPVAAEAVKNDLLERLGFPNDGFWFAAESPREFNPESLHRACGRLFGGSIGHQKGAAMAQSYKGTHNSVPIWADTHETWIAIAATGVHLGDVVSGCDGT